MEEFANQNPQPIDGPQWKQLNAQSRMYIMPDFCRFSLPYREPKTAEPWIRVNGTLTYQVTPLQYALDGKLLTLWPYGKYARLLLIYITTQVKRDPDNPTRTIYLPDNLGDLMKQLHIMRSPTGTDYKAFRRQLDAVSAMQIKITEDLSTRDQFARRTDSLTISKESYISWSRKPGDESHANGYLQLTDETWEQMRHGIPLDDDMLEVLVQMNPTSHGQIIDIYMWLSRRLYALNHSNAMQTGIITWDSLSRQFGGAYGSRKEFTRYFKNSLKKISQPWPGGLHYKVIRGEGIILQRSSLSVKPKPRKTGN